MRKYKFEIAGVAALIVMFAALAIGSPGGFLPPAEGTFVGEQFVYTNVFETFGISAVIVQGDFSVASNAVMRLKNPGMDDWAIILTGTPSNTFAWVDGEASFECRKGGMIGWFVPANAVATSQYYIVKKQY